MLRSLWIAVAAAGLFVADAASAQVMIPIHARFGQQTSIFFQARTGPFGGFRSFARGSGYGFGPAYGLAPVWHGPACYPYPYQPPIIIQNIVQQAPPVP